VSFEFRTLTCDCATLSAFFSRLENAKTRQSRIRIAVGPVASDEQVQTTTDVDCYALKCEPHG